VPASITTDVHHAAEVLRNGGLVAFGTETVYGLGANALDPIAIAKVFAAKERPSFDPLIVHIADKDQLLTVTAKVTPLAKVLADRFWPGPLTLVLPKRDSIPDLVTSGLANVGVRIPDHDLARQLIAAAGVPVAAPSANLFGRISPTTAEHVREQLGDRIDLILDGGPCRVGLESTVVDVTGNVPVVLRPGGVTMEDLSNAAGPVERLQLAETPVAAMAAPGMLERHYAPRTTLRFWNPEIESIPSGNVGLLSLEVVEALERFAAVEILSPSGDLTEAAARLFSAMRRLDQPGVELILATPVPESGLGIAINDRLRRAAAQ
jgi:L-threonylcarbamoyladenylate synthase